MTSVSLTGFKFPSHTDTNFTRIEIGRVGNAAMVGTLHLNGFKMAGRQRVFNKSRKTDVAIPKMKRRMMQRNSHILKLSGHFMAPNVAHLVKREIFVF